MSTTRKYPKLDPQGKYLVIPFSLGFSPFLTSEPFTSSCDECAVISFETLLALQEQLEAFDKEYFVPLKKIIAKHEKLKKKISKKPMKGFGFGAFSHEQILPREHIIYAGNILYLSNDPKPKSDVYGIESEMLPDIYFDAETSTTIAKFFQHLPKEAISSVKDQLPALRNFENLILISEIIFKKQRLLIPVAIFYACELIPPGHILGIDYQPDYWSSRARITHFKTDGSPIPDYYLTTHVDDYGSDKNGLNKEVINHLSQTQFIEDHSGLIFLPKTSAIALANFMLKLPKNHASQAIMLPHIFIVLFNSQIKCLEEAFTKELVIAISLPFELTNSEAKLLPQYLNQVYSRGKPCLLIRLNELKQANISEIKKIVNYLEDFYGNDNFSLNESQVYQELISPVLAESKIEPNLHDTQLLYSINPTPLFRKYQKQSHPLVIEMGEKPGIRLLEP